MFSRNTPPLCALTAKQGELHMSRVMRKHTFCICENKDADQLHGNRDADQGLHFRYTDSTLPLLHISEISRLAIFCGCTARFVSDQVGNQKVGFLMTRLNYVVFVVTFIFIFLPK